MIGYPVRILGDSEGRIIKVSDRNPRYGSIKISQRRPVMSLKGGNFINYKEITAFISGSVENLEEHVELAGWTVDKTIPGNIYIIESFSPFYPNQNPKINPETREVILVDGNQVYRQSFYDPSGREMDKIMNGIYSKGSVYSEEITDNLHLFSN